MSATSATIYGHAIKDLGLKETPGRKSTPRIALAIDLAAKWLDHDDSQTAWCGCLRGLWGLETGTGVPSDHYRAKSWLAWGQPVKLSEARQGDTVVLKRPGGYHVGLLAETYAGAGVVRVLAGNQGNQCSIASFATSDLIGVRRK